MIGMRARAVSTKFIKLQDLDKKNGVVRGEVECRSGCSFCCHKIVSLSVFEAVNIGESLIQQDWGVRDRIQKQAQKNALINLGLKLDSERWKFQQPCALLHENLCSLYDRRPLQCIFTISNSVSRCEGQFNRKKSTGHKVLKQRIQGLDTLSAVHEMAKGFDYNSAEYKSGGDVFRMYAELDLDRFIAYFIDESVQIMRQKLLLLNSMDNHVIRLLEKRTLSYERPSLTKIRK